MLDVDVASSVASLINFLTIVFVLCLPIAERHAQPVEQRPVGINPVALWRDNRVFGDELQVLAFAPAFQQILERFAHDTFAPTARYLAQAVKVGAIFVDQLAAQEIPLCGACNCPPHPAL